MGRGWKSLEVQADKAEAAMTGLLAETGTFEVTLVKPQMGTRPTPLGTGGKRPGYKAAESSAELCSSVLWTVGLVSYDAGCSAEETAKQRAEGAAWLRLTAYRKLREETDTVKGLSR